MIFRADIERGIAKEEENDEDRGAQLRIKKTQHAALLRLFMDAMNDYQLAQTDYRDRCKGRMKRQLDIGKGMKATYAEGVQLRFFSTNIRVSCYSWNTIGG